MKLKKLLLLSGVIFFQQLINAQTIYVSGHITKDTTWYADTVKIIGDIIIDNGKTLTINKGTCLQSQDYYKFIINGCLKAKGTPSDTINFTIKDTTGYYNPIDTSGSWGGFCFNQPSVENDSSEFEYCKIQFCKKPQKHGGAFSIYSYSKIKISHCLIKNNSSGKEGGSVYCKESNPTILYTTFSNNYSRGHGGAVCYNNTQTPIYFSENTFIYNYSEL